ncbi:MAG: hypothetical protein ACN4G0_03755 [Polyangiales bacterium]
MSSGKRRWLWVGAVALVAAAIWWTRSTNERPIADSAAPEPSHAEPATAPPSPPEPERAPPGPTPSGDDEGEPVAVPLPREEVELPAKQASDAGVADADPSTPEERRDRMLGVVLEQLDEDLREAKEAGDEERAARIRVRRDRLKEQRGEIGAQ